MLLCKKVAIYLLFGYFQKPFRANFDFVSWSTMKNISLAQFCVLFWIRQARIEPIYFWHIFRFFNLMTHWSTCLAQKNLWCIFNTKEIISWRNHGRNWSLIFALNFVDSVGERFQIKVLYYIPYDVLSSLTPNA